MEVIGIIAGSILLVVILGSELIISLKGGE